MKHAAMLSACGIISEKDADEIIACLESIRNDIDSGALEIDESAEDIHMFVESELTRRIGDVGKRLHTARSRNDQVALDIRMYLRDGAAEVCGLLKELIKAICSQAEKNKDAVLPGIHAFAACAADYVCASSAGICHDASPRYKPR